MTPTSKLVLSLMAMMAVAILPAAWAKCPYHHAAAGSGDAVVPGAASRRSLQMWSSQAVEALDVAAVKADIADLLVTSQAFWPIDDVRSGTPSYGPFMIRLAWHCAGSYRSSDGRGGCDGGRIRFDPERSWADNTNLDKAKTLLQPIKIKYGDALSWGDLIVLTGNTAIETMGGPVLGFCAGRIDDTDGTASLPLGPTPEQMAVANCTEPGNCQAPLGPTTMGLIYVNPEGPQGNPVPELSAPQIRDTFARMGMNDSETVALVGGGHAFGKTHGACPTGAGPSPKEDPTNPWPGTCGSGVMKGKGNNTFTSGFEGHWTTTPTLWGNEYFISLLAYDWEKEVGPGGHYQWHPKRKANDTATGPLPQIMMLTADVALLHDPSYLQLVQRYASSQDELDTAFAHAWYKLMTRDMGPVQRCLGSLTPPAQPFQGPLPPAPQRQPKWSSVRADIRSAIARRSSALAPDTAFGKPYYGALFAYAAYQCASTFRWTDKHGGCNGARIRFSPEKDWPANAGVDMVLQVLAPIKSKYGSRLTWADLIVLAGTISVESASGVKTPFCAGRSDAVDGSFSADLAPRSNYTNAWVEFRDTAAIMGLTSREAVALAARPRSHSQALRLGYSGTWHGESEVRLTNDYFKVLLENTWTKGASAAGMEEYTATGVTPPLYVTPLDMAIRWDAEYLAIAQEYAGDAATFAMEFSGAWTKLMNSDRFKGPAGSVCK